MRIRRVSGQRIDRPGRAVRAVGLGLVALCTLTAAQCRPEVISGGGTLSSSAGTVDVQCIGRNKAKIVGSSPSRGFTARIIVPGPSGQASLIFESPTANDYRVAVHCVEGEPRLKEYEVEDTAVTW